MLAFASYTGCGTAHGGSIKHAVTGPVSRPELGLRQCSSVARSTARSQQQLLLPVVRHPHRGHRHEGSSRRVCRKGGSRGGSRAVHARARLESTARQATCARQISPRRAVVESTRCLAVLLASPRGRTARGARKPGTRAAGTGSPALSVPAPAPTCIGVGRPLCRRPRRPQVCKRAFMMPHLRGRCSMRRTGVFKCGGSPKEAALGCMPSQTCADAAAQGFLDNEDIAITFRPTGPSHLPQHAGSWRRRRVKLAEQSGLQG